MMYLTGLCAFLLVLIAEARVGQVSESHICTDETNECLLYTLVCQGKDYEVRHYDPVKWVSTDERSYVMEKATVTAFRRLFKYITGENSDGVKIDMTTPVIIKIPVKNSFWESSVYTMSFLLPSKYQNNPPQPTDAKVYLSDTPDMKLYVRSYGGWLLSFVDNMQAGYLSSELDTVSAQYNHDFHYAVGYNSPMTMFNRHNEVWYISEGVPVCPGNSSSLQQSGKR